MLAQPGVTQAVDFVDASIFAKGVHPNASAGNVVQAQFGGEAVLRINIPKSSGSDPGAWRTSLNKTWTKNSQAFGVGQEFYVAFGFYAGAGYLTPSNGGGGKKQSIISQYQPESPASTSSNTPIEVVMHQMGTDAYIDAYHEPDASGFFVPKGSDFLMQTARPTCLYSNKSGCVSFVEGQWMMVLQRIKVGKFNGSTGNEYDMWIAFPGDTAWVPVFTNRGFQLGADGGGYSGVFLLPYDTNRSSGKVDTYALYKRLVASTQAITLASMR